MAGCGFLVSPTRELAAIRNREPPWRWSDVWLGRHAGDGTDTCGDATSWRELNTAHHLVKIVRDLGAMSSIEFEEDAVSEYSEQESLF